MLRGVRIALHDMKFPLLLLVALIVLRYHPALFNFWLDDDSQILKHAISYQPWQYLFVPEIWQKLSAMNFTPWVSLSFGMDWKIFGLNPYGFYLHQLISLCLLSVISFAVLRLWFPRGLSFFGVILLTTSVPFAEATQSLMMRHYVEGFVCALLSLYCFVQGVREDNKKISFLGAFFYILAVSGKEIYAPLVFLLLLLPDTTLKSRFRHAIPWFIVAVVYVFWRSFMLNRFGGLGGYGIQLTWPQDAILFFPRIVDTTGGDLGYYAIYWRYLIGASTLSAIFVLLRREKRATLFFLAGSLLVLLPIVPVSAGMSHRVVLLLVFWWIIIHIFAWDRLLTKIHSRFSQIAVFIWAAVVLSGFIYASHNHIVLTKDSIFRKGVEGRFVLQEGSSFDLLFHPVQYGHYYNGLLWLRNTVLHLPAGPAVTYDPNIICSNELLEERHRADIKKYEKAWYFDSKSNKIISENIKNFCNRENLNVIRMDVPFSLDILYKNSVITWQFGPYERGSYAILLGSVASEIYPLPMQGRRFNSYKGQTLEFRLRYESPEGWVTYSPLLDIVIDDEDYCHVRWQR